MKKVLLAFLLLQVVILSAVSKDRELNFEKEFAKIEKEYLKGDYKITVKKVETLLKKVENKLGENSLMKVRTLALLARQFDGLGKYSDYQSNMDLAMVSLNKSSKDDIALLVKTYNDLAYSFYEFGDYQKAQENIEKAVELFKQGKLKDPALEQKVKVRLAFIYYQQGYLLKAEALALERIAFAQASIVKKESVTLDNGTSKLVTVPKTEKEARIRSAAEVMNLLSKVHIENGAYTQAEARINSNYSFIKKNLGKKEITYVENQFLDAALSEIKGEKSDANKLFEKAAKRSTNTKGIKLRHTSKQAIPFQEKIILSHRIQNKDHKSKKRRRILETRLLRYYKKNSPYYAKVLMIEAQDFIIRKDYKRAEENLMEVLNNSTSYFPKNHPERVKALNLLYTIAMATDQYLKAEGALDQIMDIRKALNGENAPSYLMAKLDIASFDVQYSSKFSKAEEIFDNSFSKVESEIDHKHKKYFDYLFNYSALYQYTDRFEKALVKANKGVEDTKKCYGDKFPEYARSCAEAANVYIDLGKYADAEKNLATAYEIFKQEGTSKDNQKYSMALKTYARLYIIQGQYDDAKRLLKKSINKQESTGEQAKVSGTFDELATLNIETGKYQETERILNESIKLREEKYGSSHYTLINPLNQLSLLNLITGNYTESEKLAKRAANMSVEIFGKNSIKFAESLKLLGSVYSVIGDYEKAEEATKKALEIQKLQYGVNHIQVAMTINEIALIKFYNNSPKEEVVSLLNEALSIAKNTIGENHPRYASILYNIGLFYMETGELNKAETNLNLANATWIAKFGSSNVHSAEVSFIKGNLSNKRQNFVEAKTNYINSKSIYERIFDNTHPGYLASLSKAGQMDFINGNNKEAVRSLNETTNSYLEYIKKYFPSLSEREKTKFWNKIQKDFEFYNTLAIKLQVENPELVGNVYNFSLATKALMLSSSIKVRQRILESKDSILIKKFEDWMAKKEFMTSVISMTAEQRKENEIDIKVLESEIEGLEKELSDRSEEFASNFSKKEAYDWRDIRKNLLPNEAAVEMIRFRWFDKNFTDSINYAALIITPETKSNPELVLFKNGNEMEGKWFKYQRNCMKFNIADKHSYNEFWKPIKDKLKDSTRIYFSADGVFNQINLETIPVGNDAYVIDQNEIVLVSNTRDLITRKNQQLTSKSKKHAKPVVENTKIALFGNPSYYSSSVSKSDVSAVDSLLTETAGGSKNKVSQLPGAEKEVKGLYTLISKNGLNAESYLNEDASEKKIKELSNIKVFHIATHGFFMDEESDASSEGLNENRAIQNPLLRSGLLLKDGGYLLEKDNAYEFNSSDGILTAYEAMNLNFDNCDLVVLSACETGLGKVQQGEGVFGLQRAFLVSGAKTVVMSLFKVNDEVTQELMSVFYQNWIKTKDKKKSFLDAKKYIKDKYKNPIYWGAFIMVGIG